MNTEALTSLAILFLGISSIKAVQIRRLNARLSQLEWIISTFFTNETDERSDKWK